MARLKLDWNAALFPSTRHMVLMDLEATTSGDTQAPGDPVITDDNCEIIEIGLIVIDLEGDQMEPTAKFSLLVRPVLNPTLTQFCTRYTSIRQDEVDAAQSYLEASAALTEFVTQLDTLPGGWSWGSWSGTRPAMAAPIRCRLADNSTSRRPSRPCAARTEERGRRRRSGQGLSRVW